MTTYYFCAPKHASSDIEDPRDVEGREGMILTLKAHIDVL